MAGDPTRNLVSYNSNPDFEGLVFNKLDYIRDKVNDIDKRLTVIETEWKGHKEEIKQQKEDQRQARSDHIQRQANRISRWQVVLATGAAISGLFSVLNLFF